MQFYIFIFIILAGILTNYMVIISNLKRIRSEEEPYKPFEIILCSLFFGGPTLLLSLMFSEYREIEKEQHHIYLISGIALTLIDIAAVYLLIYFKVIIF